MDSMHYSSSLLPGLLSFFFLAASARTGRLYSLCGCVARAAGICGEQERDVSRHSIQYKYCNLQAEVVIPSLSDLFKTVSAGAIKLRKPQRKIPRSGMDLTVANDNEEEEGMMHTHYKKVPAH